MVVVAGGGECAGDTKDDDLLALERVGAQGLGNATGFGQLGVVGAVLESDQRESVADLDLLCYADNVEKESTSVLRKVHEGS